MVPTIPRMSNATDESKWEYYLPTLVVRHALQEKEEYYAYHPDRINFKTLLENVGYAQIGFA